MRYPLLIIALVLFVVDAREIRDVNRFQNEQIGFQEKFVRRLTDNDFAIPINAEDALISNLPLHRIKREENEEDISTTSLPLENSSVSIPSDAASTPEDITAIEDLGSDQTTSIEKSDETSTDSESVNTDPSAVTPTAQTNTEIENAKPSSETPGDEQVQVSSTTSSDDEHEDDAVSDVQQQTTASAGFNLTDAPQNPSTQSADFSTTHGEVDENTDEIAENTEVSKEDLTSHSTKDDLVHTTNESTEIEETSHGDSNGSVDEFTSVNAEDFEKIDEIGQDALTTTGTTENSESTETTNAETDLPGTTTTDNTPTEPTTTPGGLIPSSNETYNFLVYNESNIPCILASMNMTLKVSYKTADNKTAKKEIKLPTSANTHGTCGENKSSMTLSWKDDLQSLDENNITFEIVKDSLQFYVSSIKVAVRLSDNNDSNATVTAVNGSSADLKLFAASVNDGVHECHAETEVRCGDIVVLIKDVSFIAYNDRQDVSTRKKEYCKSAKSVSVGSIVGGIIGAAVTIGIIASFVWYRKRTNTFRSELP